MIKKSITSLIIMLVLVGAGFGAYRVAKRNEPVGIDRLAVAASYYPLYDFAKQVGGDRVSIYNMTPAGTEPHDYEPSPQDLIRAYSSAVF